MALVPVRRWRDLGEGGNVCTAELPVRARSVVLPSRPMVTISTFRPIGGNSSLALTPLLSVCPCLDDFYPSTQVVDPPSPATAHPAGVSEQRRFTGDLCCSHICQPGPHREPSNADLAICVLRSEFWISIPICSTVRAKARIADRAPKSESGRARISPSTANHQSAIWASE